MVYACPGGQLNVTCKSNASLIRWNVTVPQYRKLWIRGLSYIGAARRTTPIQIDETTVINISRTLDVTLALPLISVMLSDNVTASINGTSISCTELYMYMDVWVMNKLTTRLHVIEPGAPNYSRF